MKTYLADTNIFLRFLLGDIPHQAQIAKKKLEGAEAGKISIVVEPIVVLEIIFALEKIYKIGKSETARLAKTIVSAPYLMVKDRDPLLRALEIYDRKKIDFVDAFLFSRAQSEGAEVLSFDKDFGRLTGF